MLIDCPECKRQISATASSCPGCGYNLNAPVAKNSFLLPTLSLLMTSPLFWVGMILCSIMLYIMVAFIALGSRSFICEMLLAVPLPWFFGLSFGRLLSLYFRKPFDIFYDNRLASDFTFSERLERLKKLVIITVPFLIFWYCSLLAASYISQYTSPEDYIKMAKTAISRDASLKDAAFYYKEAAKLGSVHAEFMLGELYEIGVDGPDISQAIEWFEKAANHGDVRAKEKLIRLRNQTR